MRTKSTAIAQRLGVLRRIVTVLEGESLVNDATGLVAYRIAAVAAGTVLFSPLEATVQFALEVSGGCPEFWFSRRNSAAAVRSC